MEKNLVEIYIRTKVVDKTISKPTGVILFFACDSFKCTFGSSSLIHYTYDVRAGNYGS